MEIFGLAAGHWSAVKAIYEAGLATGNASFQSAAPSWEEWDGAHLPHSRLVAIDAGMITGWAALSPVSGRCVYTGVAEVSVYIDPRYRGRGVGKSLLQALIRESEANGIWTLQAGIFPENTASLKLHETVGFRKIGVREKIGKMGDRWRDVHFFEKRSKSIGI